MLSALREKPSLPSTRGPRCPWARHKASSDSRMGAPAQSSGEKQELWGWQRALASTGLSHGRGPTHAGAGTLPRDSASPAAPCTARPPRRQGGLAAHRDALHGGCFSSRQHQARIQPDLAAPWGESPAGLSWLSPADAGCGFCPLPGGEGTRSQAGAVLQTRACAPPGAGSTVEGRGLGTMAEGRGQGLWRRAGGRGPRQTAGALTTHPARGGWRHHPAGGSGSCKVLIITLLPGLSVCLSFQLSVSLANQRRLFQESWKRRRNVSLGRGFLWKVWKSCGISTCVKVCLARSTFSFQSCCKDVNHEPVTLLAE